MHNRDCIFFRSIFFRKCFAAGRRDRGEESVLGRVTSDNWFIHLVKVGICRVGDKKGRGSREGGARLPSGASGRREAKAMSGRPVRTKRRATPYDELVEDKARASMRGPSARSPGGPLASLSKIPRFPALMRALLDHKEFSNVLRWASPMEQREVADELGRIPVIRILDCDRFQEVLHRYSRFKVSACGRDCGSAGRADPSLCAACAPRPRYPGDHVGEYEEDSKQVGFREAPARRRPAGVAAALHILPRTA